MAIARRAYSEAERVFLTAQVRSHCPLCDKLLFYKKRGRYFSEYELAHIYPLNPSQAEVEELKSAPRLHEDINHADNIIPLCASCHTRFDKPRTLSEYLELYEIKRQVIIESEQRELANRYPLSGQVSAILTRLHEIAVHDGTDTPLGFDPKRLDEKFDQTLKTPIRRKIKNAVADYYVPIKAEFKELERVEPSASKLIFSQVKTFYLQQQQLGLPQGEIFNNVVAWIYRSTHAETLEAAEIVASFFVQNCEVFE